MAEIRIGAEQFRRQLTDLLNRVSYGADHVVVERHGTALAALIPFALYEAILVAEIPQKLDRHSTSDSNTADLAAEIEAVLQSSGITYKAREEEAQEAPAALLRERAANTYELNPFGAILGQSSTFTLEEVAMYLKLPVDVVAHSAAQGEIPGRRINETWRFLKSAIDNWLHPVDGRQILLQQAGAFADDDSLAELRRLIYQERGRPESESQDEQTTV